MEHNDGNELLEKIAESAQGIDIPEELRPHQIEIKLKARHQKRLKRYRTAAAAACLFLCFGAGSYTIFSDSVRDGRQEKSMQTANQIDQNRAEDQAAAKEPEQEDGETAKNQKVPDSQTDWKQDRTGTASRDQDAQDQDTAKETETPLKNLGKMYTLAENYGDVYDTLAAAETSKMGYETAESETNKELAVNPGASYEENARDDTSAGSGSTTNQDYSRTNLQVEGVDESDIVKTDGRYLYIAQEDQVQVLDVQHGKPVEAGVIIPDLNGDMDEICEMYVSDHMLTLLIQTEETTMQHSGGSEEAKKTAFEDTAEDAYRIDTKVMTKILTYDITEPKRAVLKDTLTQDGWYQTSRKIGGRLYLFTNQPLFLPQDLARKEANIENEAAEWIPSVNGRTVASDCIYLAKKGSSSLLVAAVNLEDHCRVVDTKLLVHAYTQLYVTSNSIYLYHTDYAQNRERTRIARFSLDDDGMIRAKAASSVRGSIRDTFAVHERDGYLQVLTTISDSELGENRVYVLDQNMKITGKLTGLAKGEQIYSARFAGTVGYFVTYRNTDPLFTVDFSDPKKPKVVGELKVTGFSEYLHFWSDTLLLGIGYETNPENGERIGVKLSMFDVSDPSNVREKGRIVLEGVDDCHGMYDYKAVLVSKEKNMIALTTESYSPAYRKDYRVFSYADGKFTSCLQRAIVKDGRFDDSKWRSVYVGDVLYLVGQNRTIAFDRNEGWKVIGRVKYEK